MSETEWNTTDRILFGIVYGAMGAGIAIWGIAQLIEACRTRPKVKIVMFGVKPKGSDNGDQVEKESSMRPE